MQTKPVFQTLLFAMLIGLVACTNTESQSTDSNQPDSSTQTDVKDDPVVAEIASAKDAIEQLQARLADTSLEASQRDMIQKAISYQEEKIERFENLSEEDKKTFRETMRRLNKETAQ
jgi:TolA-binding protein